MKTLMPFVQPGHPMLGGVLLSGVARVAGEKSARDRRATTWGGKRVEQIQTTAAVRYALTVAPSNVAPSAHERST
ncbi:hypothetical protein GCM10022243_62460 [Saccharothrix violaceirubra]|uniref:Uncharacterized protein n=1 Tax=Saccharothrix violaceirubra TaxID=413306 RepID=A0A7W7WY70_9PSEU|nr:hypothetical protein [Saccharothrix violaceirubra]MBB4968224.1 hypothetical protein [Saccharothrix violaceirubra]